jgi:cobyrinic acid a,c-diamide synthase
MARSAAAIVHGFRSFDPDCNVAGVIFNRVGSDHHEELLRDAVADLGVPVLGALRRDERVRAPERHLGLVPAGEHSERTRAALDALAAAMGRYGDLDAVAALARSAPALTGPAWIAGPADAGSGDQRAGADRAALEHSRPRLGAASPRAQWSTTQADPPALGARIAIARGPAFSFHYEENLELLSAYGAELAPFDPLSDEALPDGASGLILAGGFPEIFGAELEANTQLRAQVADFARSGRPVLAECGGLLYLCSELDEHAMCGVLPARGRMAGRLSLGYREAVAATPTPWLGGGECVRGHEFHYSTVEPLETAAPQAAWTLTARGRTRAEGYVQGGVQASYLHVHWAAHPRLAASFALAAKTAQAIAA